MAYIIWAALNAKCFVCSQSGWKWDQWVLYSLHGGPCLDEEETVYADEILNLGVDR